MSLTACIAAGSGSSSACFIPANCGVEHLALQHLLDRLVRRPGLVRVPVVRRQRPHRAGGVVGQRGELHLRPAARRRRRRRRARRAPAARAWSSAARTWSSVPPRSPRRRAALRIRRTFAARSSRPAVAVEAAPQQVARARRAASRRRARRGPSSSRAGPDVVRRRERVGTVVPGAVAEPACIAQRPVDRAAGHRRPCRSGGSGAGPRARTRSRRPPRPGDASSPCPSRSSTLDRPGHRADLVEQLGGRAPARRSRPSRPRRTAR